MRQIGVVLLTLLATGCASGPFSAKRELESSAQQQGKVVYCNGYKTWGDCNKYAAQACPNGYEVLSKEENLAIQNRALRISCK